jgi:hypothetical protein
MTSRLDPLDRAELTIRDMPLAVGRRELYAVAHRERAIRLAIERDALQAARIFVTGAPLFRVTVRRLSCASTRSTRAYAPALILSTLLPLL